MNKENVKRWVRSTALTFFAGAITGVLLFLDDVNSVALTASFAFGLINVAIRSGLKAVAERFNQSAEKLDIKITKIK